MRNWRATSPIAVLCFAWLAIACGREPTHIAVEVREGKVFIEGKQVTEKSTLSDYEAILGKSDRVSKLSNTIYTYDDLGILLYQPPGKESIISISLDIVRSDYGFSPKKSFQGVFIINSQVLRSDFPQTSLLDLKTATVDPEDKSLRFPVTEAMQKNVVLIFEYLSSRKQLEGVGISWRSDSTDPP